MQISPFFYFKSVMNNQILKKTCKDASKVDKKRLIKNNGRVSVDLLHVDKRKRKYFNDFYTSLVDAQWRWVLIAIFMAFVIFWAFYGLIYYLIIVIRDNEDSDTPCLANVQTFTAAFMLSLETQHTIGYGFRYVTEYCPEAVVALCFQSITGVMMQAFMLGVLFAKLTRPKRRLNTVIFSRVSTFCLRNGKLCLMFRLGDIRKSHIIGATVKAQLIQKHTTEEDDEIPFYQQEVSVTAEGGSENLFFMWPIIIMHVIDENSPFFDMSASDLYSADFELVVYLEGTSESTGTTIQARHSYSPSNMLWGHRFNNIISFDEKSEKYKIDFSLYDSTTEVPTPLCSARDLKFNHNTSVHIVNSITSHSNHTVIHISDPETLYSNDEESS